MNATVPLAVDARGISHSYGDKGAVHSQDTGFMPGVRVGELVRLGERSYPDAISTTEALRLADLADLADRRVDRLSGGQSQPLDSVLNLVGWTALFAARALVVFRRPRLRHRIKSLA